MISRDDCIAMCGLDEDEIAALSEHEHIPEMAATALASYLLHAPHGSETIRGMITDNHWENLTAERPLEVADVFRAQKASGPDPPGGGKHPK